MGCGLVRPCVGQCSNPQGPGPALGLALVQPEGPERFGLSLSPLREAFSPAQPTFREASSCFKSIFLLFLLLPVLLRF